jgi:hypothetical protein
MDDPSRRRAPAPVDPGPVGASPGHLRRIRRAGGLLIVATGVRFVGFVVLFSGYLRLSHTISLMVVAGVGILMLSSLLFIATGRLALARSGHLRLAPGPGRWGMWCLVAAEVIALISAGAFLPPDLDAMQLLIRLAMPLHAGLLVGAATGLLGHVRRLLRPGARMRTGLTGLLGVVIALLVAWTLSVPLELQGLMVLSMLPLPFLSVMVGVLMSAQRIPSRDVAQQAVERGLSQVGASGGGAVEEEPDGLGWTVTLGGRSIPVRLDDSRLPLALELRVPLQPALSGLVLRRRERGEPGGTTGDALLDQLICAEGVSPERAAALLSGLHAPVLSVLQGRPGSAVRDGAVILRATIGPGQDIIPRSAAAQCIALTALTAEVAGDALGLADALEARLAGLPAEGNLKGQILEDHA